MLLVYEYEEATDQVAVVTIQDSRSAIAATARKPSGEDVLSNARRP
jgi:hypothetical protein